MDETRFRPLGVGEILDAAFKIYRSHFTTLCLCVLVVVVPLAIVDTLITASVTDDAFDLTADTTSDTDASRIGAGLASLALQFLLTLLAAAACTRAVGAAYLGHRVTWQESLRFATRKLGPLIVLSIMSGLATFLGLILVIVGAIYIGVRLSIGSPALLIEDIGPVAAFRRSWGLVGGRWWATFGVIVLSSLLVFIIAAVLQALLMAPLLATDSSNQILGAIMTTLGTIVANVFTVPLQAAVVAILYFDLRVRKEGLDIQRLAESVGGTSPADVAQSSGLGGYEAGPGESGSHGGFAPPTPGGFSAPTSGDPLRRPDERDPS